MSEVSLVYFVLIRSTCLCIWSAVFVIAHNTTCFILSKWYHLYLNSLRESSSCSRSFISSTVSDLKIRHLGHKLH